MEYTKPWLTLEQQVHQLANRGVAVGDVGSAIALLREVGYYRLTGYLYPFRTSAQHADASTMRHRGPDEHRPGTTLTHVARVIDFDRDLRMLVMEGAERIEVALRMRVGHVLGRTSAFAHEDPTSFTAAFTAPRTDLRTQEELSSDHEDWLRRVAERRRNSDEPCVAHFREKYDDRMPVWALTEILELGHLSRLYKGLHQREADEIASEFDVPTKRLMVSWLASLNYVRNVAAHHARLYNRKLQNAPGRPKVGQVPILDHLREGATSKRTFGTYNALAVIAYLTAATSPGAGWNHRLAELLRTFPTSQVLTPGSMGVPEDWESLDLWRLGSPTRPPVT